MTLLKSIKETAIAQKKQIAVLIDPDGRSVSYFEMMAKTAQSAGVDFVFVGGSLIGDDQMDLCLEALRGNCSIPLILFPGSVMQVNGKADAILFLSLISGRNPEMLIGRQVVAAPYIKKAGLEAIATGYMLIDSGRSTTALYMSNTLPIPSDKPQIAGCTAMAGEMLGLQVIYLDGGSGAENPISADIIREVRNTVNLPIIVGGGIRTEEQAIVACEAGADIVVVGTIAEKDPSRLVAIAKAVHQE